MAVDPACFFVGGHLTDAVRPFTLGVLPLRPLLFPPPFLRVVSAARPPTVAGVFCALSACAPSPLCGCVCACVVSAAIFCSSPLPSWLSVRYVMPNGTRYPFRIGPRRDPHHPHGSPSPLHTSDSSDTFVHKLRSRLIVVRYSRRWRRRAALRLRHLARLRRAFILFRLIPESLEVPVWDNVLLFL